MIAPETPATPAMFSSLIIQVCSLFEINATTGRVKPKRTALTTATAELHRIAVDLGTLDSQEKTLLLYFLLRASSRMALEPTISAALTTNSLIPTHSGHESSELAAGPFLTRNHTGAINALTRKLTRRFLPLAEYTLSYYLARGDIDTLTEIARCVAEQQLSAATRTLLLRDAADGGSSFLLRLLASTLPNAAQVALWLLGSVTYSPAEIEAIFGQPVPPPNAAVLPIYAPAAIRTWDLTGDTRQDRLEKMLALAECITLWQRYAVPDAPAKLRACLSVEQCGAALVDLAPSDIDEVRACITTALAWGFERQELLTAWLGNDAHAPTGRGVARGLSTRDPVHIAFAEGICTALDACNFDALAAPAEILDQYGRLTETELDRAATTLMSYFHMVALHAGLLSRDDCKAVRQSLNRLTHHQVLGITLLAKPSYRTLKRANPLVGTANSMARWALRHPHLACIPSSHTP